MSKAFVFPGQGSQYVGMGKDLCEKFPEAKRLFDEADALLGVSLSSICFNGPEEELKQTKNTQPAIFLHSVAVWNQLKPTDAAMVAGHSLGEYSALVAAEAISFADAIKLVRLRGELMQKAGQENPGTMAAVVGLDPAVVSEVTVEASAVGVVQPANFNSPGQIVISGSVEGVRKAMELAKAKGAKLVKELVVSGAFHSPLMQSAKDALKSALDAAEIRDASRRSRRVIPWPHGSTGPNRLRNYVLGVFRSRVKAPSSSSLAPLNVMQLSAAPGASSFESHSSVLSM